MSKAEGLFPKGMLGTRQADKSEDKRYRISIASQVRNVDLIWLSCRVWGVLVGFLRFAAHLGNMRKILRRRALESRSSITVVSKAGLESFVFWARFEVKSAAQKGGFVGTGGSNLRGASASMREPKQNSAPAHLKSAKNRPSAQAISPSKTSTGTGPKPETKAAQVESTPPPAKKKKTSNSQGKL